MSGESRQKWELDLIAPLPWQERSDSPDVIEAEMEAFTTFMSQTN